MAETNTASSGNSNNDGFQTSVPEDRSLSVKNLARFKDIKLEVKATLGRINIPLKQYLKLVRGSIIDLGKTDNLIIHLDCNDKEIAKGDIFVLEKKIGVEIKSFDTKS